LSSISMPVAVGVVPATGDSEELAESLSRSRDCLRAGFLSFVGVEKSSPVLGDIKGILCLIRGRFLTGML
jgi:hypothetical protein